MADKLTKVEKLDVSNSTNSSDKGSGGNQNDEKAIEKKAKELGLLYLGKIPSNIPTDVINMIPEEAAKRYKTVPFELSGEVLKVAVIDPKSIDVANIIRFVSEEKKVSVEEYLISEKTFAELLECYSGANEFIKEAFDSLKSNDIETIEEESLTSKQKKDAEIFKDAPIAKLVEVLVSHAIEGKASDIHIEPMDKNYRVRFRVDGVLHVSLLLPKEIGPVVISRIKILSNLKIEEKRKPQDGRFRILNKKKEVDFRVSTLPVLDGEKVVLRLLDKDGGVGQVENLGLLGLAQENMKLAIKETYGMILLTGPTGSGKSTTSYALLKILNQEERNIITLEDPVEYFIEGINQSQVKPEIGYTFASGLRTVLRQDPNVILVGEIRDKETAELAVHAALTGHLLFSTLHTNTAAGSIPRLMDMGIEPFLLASSLRIVVAQRLLRRICEKCKEEVTVPELIKKKILSEIVDISEKEFEKYGLNLKDSVKFYHGKGCPDCNNTGLKGRVAIYEAVPVTENIRNIMIEKKGAETLIEAESKANGILTLKQDAILKILMGLTTIEEVERVTEGGFELEEEDI